MWGNPCDRNKSPRIISTVGQLQLSGAISFWHWKAHLLSILVYSSTWFSFSKVKDHMLLPGYFKRRYKAFLGSFAKWSCRASWPLFIYLWVSSNSCNHIGLSMTLSIACSERGSPQARAAELNAGNLASLGGGSVSLKHPYPEWSYLAVLVTHIRCLLLPLPPQG